MAQIGFTLSDTLCEHFDAYVAGRGGRGVVLRQLMEQALAAHGVDVETSPITPSPEVGNREGIFVRLNADDLKRVDEEANVLGMTRGQWLVAYIRRGLHGGRHFGKFDRERLGKIVAELREVKSILFRYAGALQRAPRDVALVERHHDRVLELDDKVTTIAKAIEGAFHGNDAYWDAVLSDASPKQA